MVSYPLLTAAIRRDADTDQASAARRETKFRATVEVLVQATEAGRVSKAVLDDARQSLNRAFDAAWEMHVKRAFIYMDRAALSEAENDLTYALGLYPECHTVGSFEKRIAKSGLDTPMVQAMRAVLAEVAPLAAMSVALKDKVVKRETKAQKIERERYAAPAVESAAKAAIRKNLTDIAEGARKSLEARIAKQYTGYLNSYLTADLAFIVNLPSQPTGYHTPYDFFVSNRTRLGKNPEAAEIVQTLIAPRNQQQKPVALANAAEKITARAVIVAAEIVKFFVEKNLVKLASVIETKGDFRTATVLSNNINVGGLEGTMHVEFTDGASFVVSNSVVFVRNSYGTEFNRFPLTFHAVRFANGSKMGQPSEKRMNEVFAKAA